MKPLCIVGSHSETRDLAPFDDPGVEIWAFNEALSQAVHKDGQVKTLIARADAIFQLHDPAVYRSEHNRSDRHHWDWLQQDHGDLVIYMREADPLVPNSRRLPIEALYQLLDNFHQGLKLEPRKYLTSSPAIALALAIHLGYRRILIFGVNMASDTEYKGQREGVTFWIGYALGRGIIVDMVSGDDIFQRPVYGYEGYLSVDPALFHQRADELRQEIGAIIARRHQAENDLYTAWRNGSIAPYITAVADEIGALGNAEGKLFEIDRYGFKLIDMQKDNLPFIDRNEYEMAAAKARKSIESLQPMVFRTAGHIDICLSSYEIGRRPEYLAQVQDFVKKHFDAVYQAARANGIYEENTRLMREFDMNYQAAGMTEPQH